MKKFSTRIVMTLLLFAISTVFLISKAEEVMKAKGNLPLSIKGSFAVATVYKDGILLGADSRGTISDSLGKKLAYYDGVQKVFPIGKAALAYTGQETILNIYFGAIVHSFARTVSIDIALEDIIPTFLKYIDNNLPREASEIVRTQQLIVAGFSEGKAYACYYNQKQTSGPKNVCGLGLISSDKSIIDEYKKQLQYMEEQTIEELIRKAIHQYAEDKNAEDIGGPIYIRAIRKNDAYWLGNAPTSARWEYLHEFAESYWAGKIKLQLLPGATQEELDAIIRLAETWSKNAGQKQ